MTTISHNMTDIILLFSVIITFFVFSKAVHLIFFAKILMTRESVREIYKSWIVILIAIIIFQLQFVIDSIFELELHFAEFISIALLYFAINKITNNISSEKLLLANSRDLIIKLNLKTNQLETINNAIQALFTEVEKKPLLLKVLNSAKELTGSKFAALGIKGPDGGLSEFIPLGMANNEGQQIPIGKGLLKKVMSAKRTYVSDDISKDPYFTGFPLEHLPMKTFLGTPISPKINESEGLIFLADKHNNETYDENDIQAVETMAKAASVALEKIALYSDITAAKVEWEKTFDAMSELVIILNSDLEILKANMAVVLGTEQSYVDLLGNHFSTIFESNEEDEDEAGEKRSLSNHILNVFKTKEPTSFERNLKKVDCDYWINVSPFHQDGKGNVDSVILVMTDIRSLKKLTVVEEEKKALVEAAAYKTRLIATVSHELRNPLTSIMGYIDLIRTHDIDNETRDKWFDIIQSEAVRITSFIEEVLNFTKIESGKLTLNRKKFQIEQMVEIVSEPFTNRSDIHTVKIECNNNDPFAYGDEAKIARVLINLIDNSIKYSPDGGHITVSLSCKDDKTFTISVKDNGIGIPEEYIERIFEPFHRVETPDRMGIKGTGLGLSICQSIIELHGCKIWVDSVGEGTNRGTTFSFTVPKFDINYSKNTDN